MGERPGHTKTDIEAAAVVGDPSRYCTTSDTHAGIFAWSRAPLCSMSLVCLDP